MKYFVKFKYIIEGKPERPIGSCLRGITARDGFEVIEQVKRKTPDLISLDLVMPKGWGRNSTGNRQKMKCHKTLSTDEPTGRH